MNPPLPEWKRCFSESERTQLIQFQEDLHRHPELSFQEIETSKKAIHLLNSLNPHSITPCAKTGVLALFKGTDPSSTSLTVIRGDMDALPITEATGLPYSSQTPGVMHACGHDVHTTWAIGAAMLLKKNPPKSNYAILLQPAEEITLGAKAVLESGVLSGATRIVGAHVDRNFPVGHIICQPGSIAASSDILHIDIYGESAHGARPQEGKDPFPVLAAIIQAINTIPSRSIHPDEASVISLGIVKGGNTHNIIPDHIQLQGTIRALTPATRDFIHSTLKKICDGMAASFSCKVDLSIITGTPPVMNHAHVVESVKPKLDALFKPENVTTLPKANLASEDFAYYLEKIPGVFLRIGARLKTDIPIPAHNKSFFVEQDAIFAGASALASCV